MLSQAYKHKNIRYVLNSIENYRPRNRFDCVTAMFNVAGYVRLEGILEHLPLTKKGCFLFDCWDYHRIQKDKPHITTHWIGENLRVIIPKSFYATWIESDILIIKPYQKIVTEYHKVYNYMAEEIEEIAKEYGFKVVEAKPGKGWVRWYKLQRVN